MGVRVGWAVCPEATQPHEQFPDSRQWHSGKGGHMSNQLHSDKHSLKRLKGQRETKTTGWAQEENWLRTGVVVLIPALGRQR